MLSSHARYTIDINIDSGCTCHRITRGGIFGGIFGATADYCIAPKDSRISGEYQSREACCTTLLQGCFVSDGGGIIPVVRVHRSLPGGWGGVCSVLYRWVYGKFVHYYQYTFCVLFFFFIWLTPLCTSVSFIDDISPSTSQSMVPDSGIVCRACTRKKGNSLSWSQP